MEEISQQIARLRREYMSQAFDETLVRPNAIDQFKSWFQDAIDSGQIDTEAMTLSTVDEKERISARIVLLKDCDERGFVFFTNYESRKSREMVLCPMVALTFYWPLIQRQVRIEGKVTKTSREESESYFETRPRGSQIGAWASPQSEIISDRNELQARWAKIEERFKDVPVPCPPMWGGFRIIPDTLEFWQGRENRLHDRIHYMRSDHGWQITRLAP